MRAIRYAADKSNINVIVLPYTFPAQDDLAHLIESACNYAYSQGKLVVASSGNVHPALNEVYYPANVSCVVAVGATDKNDERWTDSNYGPELDFVAPGVDINLTNLGGGYVVESGTSYSAPYVAAAAALVFATYPGEDNQFVWRTLNSTVHDLGAAGWDEEFGMGLVNAYWPCQLPPGDVNGDHKVDIFDATLIAKHFGSVYPEASYYAVADINIDRVIDIFDIVQVALYFGQVYNP